MTGDQIRMAQWSAESTDDNPVPLIDPQPVIDELLALRAERDNLQRDLEQVNAERHRQADVVEAARELDKRIVIRGGLSLIELVLHDALATLDKAQQADSAAIERCNYESLPDEPGRFCRRPKGHSGQHTESGATPLTEAERKIRECVDQQAEDAGLWFFPQTAAEAYLQQELRKLHAVIESGEANPSAC